MEIVKINEVNYPLFDDMVYWRVTGEERKQGANVKTDFSEAKEQLQQEGFSAYAALVEGRFVAWITFIHIPKIGKWHRGIIYIDELWTAPQLRRKGIAYALMEKAFEAQKETNAVKVRLYTDNEPAQRLYEKLGLKVTNRAVFMESDEQ